MARRDAQAIVDETVQSVVLTGHATSHVGVWCLVDAYAKPQAALTTLIKFARMRMSCHK